MNRTLIASVAVGLFALAPLTACNASNFQSPAKKAGPASFSNIVTRSNGSAAIIQIQCPTDTTMALTIGLDNATDGNVTIRVTSQGQTIASGVRDVDRSSIGAQVTTPAFPRQDTAIDGVRIEVIGAKVARGDQFTTARDNQFAEITGLECSSNALRK